MALVFIGCLNYEQEVSLYPDGSGTMKIHYWMKFDDTLKTGLIDQTGLFNKDSINIKFTSKYFKLESLETYSDTTDSTTHAKIEISFEFIDLLNNSKPFSEANFQLSDGAEGQKVFSQYIPPIVSGFGIDGSEFTVTYIYDFPGEIIVHNANIVEKKRLIWKYTLSEIGKGKTISVTYRPFKLKETPAWIFILSGAVLLIVIFYLFKKKK
jgi:hypothetical protein